MKKAKTYKVVNVRADWKRQTRNARLYFVLFIICAVLLALGGGR